MRAQAAPMRATIQSGTGHDVIYFEALAFWEAALPNRATPRPEQGPSAVVMTRCWVTSEAVWHSRTLNGNGSVLAFCEAAYLISMRDAMLGYFRGCMGQPPLNGDSQSWLSMKLLCRGTAATA